MNRPREQLRWDGLALVTFTLTAAACYLAWWWTGYLPWLCYGSAVLAVGALGLWLRWLWPRVTLWLTKFFCLAALLDLLLEGFVHPFHPETLAAKLGCQLTLFGAYALYLAVLRPLDARFPCHIKRPARPPSE